MKKFTLLEMLIVIAVIAILISILLPSLKRAREQTITAVCLSNQKQIATAEYSYISQNDNYFTPSSLADYYNHVSFDDLLSNYLGFELTMQQKRGTLHKDSELTKQLQSYFICPNDDIETVDKWKDILARRSYSFNAAGGGSKGLGFNGWSRKYMTVTNPSETILTMEQHHEYNVLTRGNHSYAVSLQKWLLSMQMSPHGKLKFTWALVDGSAKIINPYDTGGLNSNWGMWEAVRD